ncbi:hypothetical protein [Streptomyces botrytidirepellens]|nr:hypothetical protein [Streptomyces botrytidirepellens]
MVFSGEVWFRRYRRICIYNDASSPDWCVVYRWYERGLRADSYLDGGSHGLVREAASDLEHAAGLVERRLVGPMKYEFLWDFSTLDPGARRQVLRMRRRLEYRPWCWSRMVLVRAWQATVPADSRTPTV